jgi:hypothetical protein
MNGRLTEEDHHAWHILVDRNGDRVGGAFLSGIVLPNDREGEPPNRSLVEGPAYPEPPGWPCDGSNWILIVNAASIGGTDITIIQQLQLMETFQLGLGANLDPI